MPLDGLDPRRVRLDHVHAAFSSWFDRSGPEHRANDKPYAVSPPTEFQGRIGVEIAVLTNGAEDVLARAGAPGRSVRLGAQIVQTRPPILMHAHSWQELEASPGREWTLEFVTPTTFRTGNRSSPLPTVATVMAGLSRAWNTWSDRPSRTVDPRIDGALWVSDLDLRSTMLSLAVRPRGGAAKMVHLSCALGSITLRCEESETADRVGPLIQLAPYAGVGSMRQKGLGVVRLHRARNDRTASTDEVRGRVVGAPG